MNAGVGDVGDNSVGYSDIDDFRLRHFVALRCTHTLVALLHLCAQHLHSAHTQGLHAHAHTHACRHAHTHTHTQNTVLPLFSPQTQDISPSCPSSSCPPGTTAEPVNVPGQCCPNHICTGCELVQLLRAVPHCKLHCHMHTPATLIGLCVTHTPATVIGLCVTHTPAGSVVCVGLLQVVFWYCVSLSLYTK